MLTLTDADKFFSNHLLKEKYFEFTENERSAAVNTAALDITAAMKLDTLPEVLPQKIAAAICEQAIYLLLNPHILTGVTNSGDTEIVSPRAQQLLCSAEPEDQTDQENQTGQIPAAPEQLPAFPVLQLQRG